VEQTAKLNVFGRVKRVPVTRRERWAWYFYDFGNSSYAAVVLLAVYSAYFKQTVVGGPEGSRLWGFSVGIAMLVTAILSPILGAMADSSATKKRLLSIFTITSVSFTALLFFVQKGDVWMGMLFFILAEIGYRGGQVFYNALLPDIASPEEIGRVSGNGWALGSLGGIICLVVVLGLILAFKGTFMIRVAFLITAVFYGLSVLPLFLFVRERTSPQPLPDRENYITFSMKKLAQTWRQAAQFKQFILFVVSFLVFNNAIMMTMDFAGIIGVTLFNFSQQQLIVFMIIVQVTSVMGAFVFGKLVDRLTSKRALIFALLGMMLACSSLFWVNSVLAFNLVGALAGFMLTGVQSVSRTTVGQLAPEEKSTEFFGIFSLAGQISNFTGPALYGLLATAIALSRERKGWDPLLAEQSGMRVAVIAMVAFLAAGLIVLLFVRNWQRKERSADQAAGEKALS
jgi:UMF1 family MFS transporter